MSVGPKSAEFYASEALINCFLREGGGFSLAQDHDDENARLRLQVDPGQVLTAPVERRGRMGDVRLSGPVRLGARPLGAVELASLLAGTLAGGLPMARGRVPDWRENLEDSLRVTGLILQECPAGREAAEIADFIASEQSLRLGHRYHPSPKSRLGFAAHDLRAYSPEWRPVFPLKLFALGPEQVSVRGDRDFVRGWQERIGVGGEEIVLPMHPWQARVYEKSMVACRPLEGVQVMVAPMSSVRTLYCPELDLFFKTSLDVRITNCIRRNSAEEMEAIARLNPVLDALPLESPVWRIQREPASLDLPGVSAGVIFRTGIAEEIKAGRTPLLAASVFGDREFSVARLRLLLGATPVSEWFARYCELLIPPVMSAFFDCGLMYEPHLQNVSICMRDGRVEGFLIRDLDNFKIVPGLLAEREAACGPGPVQESLRMDAVRAWKRLVYTLFVNHLSEAVMTLSGLAADKREAERELWLVVRRVLLQIPIPSAFRSDLLGHPHLWTKCNFITRITRTNDLEAAFAPVPNPLTLDPA